MNNVVLITGAGGMVGSHMIDHYKKTGGAEVVGTYHKRTTNLSDIAGKAQLVECDVRYYNNVYNIINKFRPTHIFHLAAQSYPTVSWDKPWETIDINITGTINIYEAIKMIRQVDADYDPMVVVACSSAEYGASLESVTEAVDESTPLLPLHPYGVSKVGQDLISYQYFVNFGIRCIRARIFNTTGPRKVKDVCSDFVKRVVSIERAGGGCLRVGNLETERAIMDVRDLVSALILLGDKGDPGEVYNISGSAVYKMGDIVDILRRYAKAAFDVKVDPALLRPSDEKIICGDSTKLIKQTGWKQQYTLEETIKDMLDYERNKRG